MVTSQKAIKKAMKESVTGVPKPKVDKEKVNQEAQKAMDKEAFGFFQDLLLTNNKEQRSDAAILAEVKKQYPKATIRLNNDMVRWMRWNIRHNFAKLGIKESKLSGMKRYDEAGNEIKPGERASKSGLKKTHSKSVKATKTATKKPAPATPKAEPKPAASPAKTTKPAKRETVTTPARKPMVARKSATMKPAMKKPAQRKAASIKA